MDVVMYSLISHYTNSNALLCLNSKLIHVAQNYMEDYVCTLSFDERCKAPVKLFGGLGITPR
jgi:hypothetical protein